MCASCAKPAVCCVTPVALHVLQINVLSSALESFVCSSGDPTGAEKHAFHSLVWFDHMLRTVGPLFPFMLLATRYRLATLAPEILAFDQQPWVEQVVVYIGLTLTRLAIYFIHRLGNITTLTLC